MIFALRSSATRGPTPRTYITSVSRRVTDWMLHAGGGLGRMGEIKRWNERVFGSVRPGMAGVRRLGDLFSARFAGNRYWMRRMPSIISAEGAENGAVHP